MGPLAGVRVVDLTIVVQGPQAGAMLADLGADVVKVELPGVGDLARYLTLSPDDARSAYFQACNRGKRGAVLDLRTDGGRRALLGLARWADVVLSNFTPGVMDGWGLGYEELAAVNERVVYATASAFGPVGPDAGREGADLAGQSAGGLISTTGLDDGEPTPVAAVIADHSGSQNLVTAVLAALFHRERTGRGQRVDVSLLGAMVWAQASELTHYLLSGRVPGRSNRGHPLIFGIYRMFRTADGWISIVGVPAPLFPGFCRALELPELAADPRFSTLLIARDDLPDLFALLEPVFLRRTTADWAARLRAEGQRFAEVRDYAAVAADEQVWANGYLVEVEHPEWGPVKAVGNPLRFSDTPASVAAVAPELGQHTEEVLLEAGFSWEEMAELRAAGAW
jgi:crotonobetainyl-CoA:carnitine CoA-transferase CaiB-like acyl-CoA transferase